MEKYKLNKYIKILWQKDFNHIIYDTFSKFQSLYNQSMIDISLINNNNMKL